jgi:hypothetical protein
LKGPRVYNAQEPAIIINEMKRLDSHERSLEAIADLINPKIFGITDLGKANYIKADILVAPRQLHNLFQACKFDVAEQKLLREAVVGLKFPVEYWDPLDTAKITLAVKAMVTGEFLGDDAPIPLRNEVLLTKDPILSTLAAFGGTAPSLIGRGSSYSVVITGKKTMKKDMPNNLKLDGFPIFAKNLQDAYEDWISVKSSSTIHFKVRNAPNKPPAIMGLTRFVPFDDGGDRINELISIFSSKEKLKTEKKRGRKTSDEGGDDAKSRASKKSKKMGDKSAMFANMGFLGPQKASDSMEID